MYKLFVIIADFIISYEVVVNSVNLGLLTNKLIFTVIFVTHI